MRQVLGPGALGRPRGIGWRRRWEGGSGWGIRVNTWLIHVNVSQNPLQYCKVISLQLIKKKEKKRKKRMKVNLWGKKRAFPFKKSGKLSNVFIIKRCNSSLFPDSLVVFITVEVILGYIY